MDSSGQSTTISFAIRGIAPRFIFSYMNYVNWGATGWIPVRKARRAISWQHCQKLHWIATASCDRMIAGTEAHLICELVDTHWESNLFRVVLLIVPANLKHISSVQVVLFSVESFYSVKNCLNTTDKFHLADLRTA